MTRQLKAAIAIIFVGAAIAGFFWVARYFGGGESVESEKPAVICKPQNAPPEQQECFWTAHIHATVRVFKNGTEIPVRFEEGKLEGQHTHSEPNKLHWHGLIPVDPRTKEVADWSVFEVQRIIADFGLSQEGTPRFIVNGEEVAPFYVWEDGDIIETRYE
jgi:hypothetical protein